LHFRRRRSLAIESGVKPPHSKSSTAPTMRALAARTDISQLCCAKLKMNSYSEV
jgi:hypothetical protein